LEILNNICTNLSDQNLKLINFISQNQESFNDLNTRLKNIQQDLFQFKNNIEKSFKEIDVENKMSQNFLARLVSGANTKLAREQINQKQIELVNQLQRINDVLNQICREIDDTIYNFVASSQRLIAEFKEVESQLQMALKTNQTTNQESLNTAYVQLQIIIKQAIEALNVARRGLEQQKIYSELNKSIDNLLQ